MGQQEIIDFLRSVRKKGDDGWYSSRQIKEYLNGGSEHAFAINKALLQLVRYKIIEYKQQGDWMDYYRVYRLKSKYSDKEDEENGRF